MLPPPKRHAHACFTVPRAAITALLAAQADAVTIATYLTLSCHTDKTGMYSSASVHAIKKYRSVDGARANKAIGYLATMTPPLIVTRDAWEQNHAEPIPDGPTQRSRVRIILPTFDEAPDQRVWIASGLVHGDDAIAQPLRALKDCGDMAARALLALYEAQDLERWYGIPPHVCPWVHYRLEERTDGPLRILLAAKDRLVLPTSFLNRINPVSESQACLLEAAIGALQHAGLLYESVVLLNRHPVPKKFSNGEPCGYISSDADILCDVATPSSWGCVPEQEWTLGAAYRETLRELAIRAGCTDAHTYLAKSNVQTYEHLVLTSTGHPVMIAGLFRLRFRLINLHNPFIEEATRRHREASATAFRQLNYLRSIQKLDPLSIPPPLQSSQSPQSPSMPLNPLQSESHGEKNKCAMGVDETTLNGAGAEMTLGHIFKVLKGGMV